MRRRGRFRQAINIVDIDSSHLLELLDNSRRYRRTTTERLAQRGEVACFDVRMIQQRDEDRDCRHRKAATPLLRQPQCLGRVKAVKHNNGHANQRGHSKMSDQASDMKERGHTNDDVIAVKLHPLLIEGGIKNNIAMCVHGPLWATGGARSVSKKGHVRRCKGSKLYVRPIKLVQQFEHIQRLSQALLLR